MPEGILQPYHECILLQRQPRIYRAHTIIQSESESESESESTGCNALA